jgi:alpha-glucosidase
MPWTNEAPNAGFTTGKPWLPVAAPHLAAAVSVQEHDPESPLNFARSFIAWRRQQPQLTRGDIAFFDTPEPVLALRRDLDGRESLLAAFNLGDKEVSFDWPESAQAEALGGHGLPGDAGSGRVTLPPYGAWFGTVHPR